MKAYTYKDSGIEWLGEIPSHWKADRIKDKTLSLVGGDWGSDLDSKDEGDPVTILRVADLEGINFSSSNLTIRKIKESSYESRKVTDKSLIIEKSGGGEKQLVGRVGNPSSIKTNAICSNFMANITFDNTVDIGFMSYMFSCLYNSKLQYSFIQQTTGIQNLNVNYYLTRHIPIPPLSEQKEIVDFLYRAIARIDRIISVKEEQLEGLNALLIAKMQEATLKGLDKSTNFKKIDSEWIESIPDHWSVQKVKRICTVFRGKFTHRPRNDPRFYNGKYPFIQTGSITNTKKYIYEYTQTLNELGLSVSQMFPKGTLCMTIAGNIGDLAILNFDACFPDSIVGFNPRWNVDLDFLYYQFEAIKQDFLSTAIVTTQMNLNINRIGNVNCYLPPLEEQKQIVEYLDELNNKVDLQKNNLHTQIEVFKKYRKSLIHECVTGKKQVTDRVE